MRRQRVIRKKRRHGFFLADVETGRVIVNDDVR